MFSKAAAPFYIPPTTSSHPCQHLFLSGVFFSHSSAGEMVPHCDFDLHFPTD